MSDARTITAHHEAGHAVAVCMRGGSELRAVVIDEEHHGNGLTTFRSKPVDNGFIAYAGCWAQARFLWGTRALDECDDEGLEFPDCVMGVLIEQPGDAEIVDAATIAHRATLESAGLDHLSHDAHAVWMMELERQWLTIQTVAGALLSEGVVTTASIRQLIERED